MATETLILLAAITTGVITAALQNLKWLRVAQRVHYLPPRSCEGGAALV